MLSLNAAIKKAEHPQKTAKEQDTPISSLMPREINIGRQVNAKRKLR